MPQGLPCGTFTQALRSIPRSRIVKTMLRKAERAILPGESRIRLRKGKHATTYTVYLRYRNGLATFDFAVPPGEYLSDFDQIKTLSILWPRTKTGREFSIPEDGRRELFDRARFMVFKKTQYPEKLQ